MGIKDKQVCKQEGRKYEATLGADRLKAMFEAQRDFSKRMGVDFNKLTLAQREAGVKDDVLCIMMELAELLNWTNWKSWKKEKIIFELEQAEFEVADLWAFLMRTAMRLGMDDEDFFQRYMRKVEINHERQDKNY